MRRPVLTATLPLVAMAVALLVGPASALGKSPSLGETVRVKPLSGQVRVKSLGSSSYRLLTETRIIKLGSTVDATKGRVKITAASSAAGNFQTGEFYDGAFTLAQKKARAAVVELKLARGNFGACGRAGARSAATSGRAVRRLWGKGKGRFRTRARYAAATVRGTTWLTEDFCDKSRAESREGNITAAPTVTAGSSFTAKALEGATFDLKPGQSIEVFCAPAGPRNVSGLYCVFLLSRPADRAFGWGIAVAETPFEEYFLCIVGAHEEGCASHPWTFFNEGPTGVRLSNILCGAVEGTPRGPLADYNAVWVLGDQILHTIRFSSAYDPFSTSWSCVDLKPPE